MCWYCVIYIVWHGLENVWNCMFFCAILNWTQNLIIALLPSNSHLHLLFDLNEMTLACEDAWNAADDFTGGRLCCWYQDRTKAMLIHELTLINWKLENSVTCIRHSCNRGFTGIFQSCYMDLFRLLLYGFVKVLTWICLSC